MKRSNKKGFTIVELIVVIAVIAVLTAVLIPTFGGIIKKANASADQQMVYSMNKILTAEEAVGGKPKTLHDALILLEDNGFKVENLDAKSADYQLLWNQKTNKIVILDTNGASVLDEFTVESSDKYLNWAFVKDEAELAAANEAGYSVFLNSNFPSSNVGVVAGIEVGTNTNVNVTVNHTGATVADYPIAINTNGGTLTVNAPEADVFHYGFSDNIAISAVADSSYHENGVATVISIEKGNFVAEPTAVISTLKVNGTATASKDDKAVIIESNKETLKTDLTKLPAPSNSVAMVASAEGVLYISDLHLLSVIPGSKVVVLTDDVVVDSSAVSINSGETVKFNMAGYSIETAMRDTVSHFYAFDVYGNLTLENGTINARGVQTMKGGKITIAKGSNVEINAIDSNGGAAFWIYAGGEVEINDGMFTALNGERNDVNISNNPGVINNSGKVTINGGTFKSQNTVCYLLNNHGDMTISDGTFEGTHGIVATGKGSNTVITGGTFTLNAYDDGKFTGHIVYGAGNVTINAGSLGGHNSVWYPTDNGKFTVKAGVIVNGEAISEDEVHTK